MELMPADDAWPPVATPLAVLVSGGLDSFILLGEALDRQSAIYPLYVRNGFLWEETEQAWLQRALASVAGPRLRPLHTLDVPVADLYPAHWSLTGRDVPDADTSDEAVFLPGRNVLLLSKALLWCHLHDVPGVALAPLASNPFPDATDAFFRDYEAVVNAAVGGRVRIWRPYAGLHKLDVMRRGAGLPLHRTFSCIQPEDGLHCGRCNKCAERRRAFADAGLLDATQYGEG
jgi:7-cyano-7-deazaguanine synthase